MQPTNGTAVDLRRSGSFLRIEQGTLQARIFENTGHIELAGPDLAGAARALTITLTPPVAKIEGQPQILGRVVSSHATASRLELVQALGPPGHTVATSLSFEAEAVLRYEVTDWKGPRPSETAIEGASPAGEHFYGFGEKFDRLDQGGKTVHNLTFDEPGNKGDRSYKVAPWFISTRGYGFHLDSSAESRFTMPSVEGGRFAVMNPLPSLAFELIYGPRLTDVLSRYTGRTGRPALPPPWAFGPWVSSDIWRSGGEIRYAVTKFRERRIPVSAFVFDSPWGTAYNDFRFNMTQFGRGGTFEGKHFDGFTSLGEMMRFLQQNGLKVILWMTPFVNTVSNHDEVPGQLDHAANHEEGAERGFFVRASPGGPPLSAPWWKGKGSPIDFTNRQARDWLTGQLTTLLTDTKIVMRSGGTESAIGGFKTDDGESGNGPNTYIPATASYADGRTGREMRNGYALEYHRTVWNVLKERGLLFARSGFTGTQAFPGCWAGDNEPNFGEANGLPSVIVAGLSAAMSGYAIWGHDVGGYQNTNFSISRSDLFMRWTQFGCFSPIMQMHRQVDPDPTNMRQYPWGYANPGESADNNLALANFRTYARLHTNLFPYIYTYAKKASETGLPILRPLVLLHQDDPNTYEVKHTYYFGAELLVAPFIEPKKTARNIYLPAGEWFDFWTAERFTGGKVIAWSNPDSTKLPVFVRGGGIIPMLAKDVDTLCDPDYVNNSAIKTAAAGLLFLLYPAEAGAFAMFDGTELRYQSSPAATSLSIASAARQIALKIHLASAPARVQLQGTDLPLLSQSDLDAATAGWRYDGVSRFLHVKLQHSGETNKIVF
jgi:alpha-D-xyloside xylohydrolase